MTPRALLTSIGATASAFAVAIGVVAGSSTGMNTSESGPIAFAAPAAHHRIGVPDWSEGAPLAGQRLAAWNDPCTIAM